MLQAALLQGPDYSQTCKRGLIRSAIGYSTISLANPFWSFSTYRLPPPQVTPALRKAVREEGVCDFDNPLFIVVTEDLKIDPTSVWKPSEAQQNISRLTAGLVCPPRLAVEGVPDDSMALTADTTWAALSRKELRLLSNSMQRVSAAREVAVTIRKEIDDLEKVNKLSTKHSKGKSREMVNREVNALRSTLENIETAVVLLLDQGELNILKMTATQDKDIACRILPCK